ncbi:MAG: branched-chain amino acid ABC transporter permease [Desulfatiglandaceae bacterium]
MSILKPLAEKVKNPQMAAILIALAALATAPLFISNEFYLDGFVLVFLWGAFAGAWNILGGYAGMVSLGHNAFFAIGAYTSTLLFLNFGLSPWLGMIVGAMFAALVGVVLGLICFRLRSHYFALATLAFGQVSFIIAINWRSVTQGAEGLALPIEPDLSNMLFAGKLPYVYMGLILFLIVLAVSFAIEHSRLGYYLTAFRENEDAARALGVRTGRVRLIAIAVSAFLSAVTGTFYAQYVVYIDPISVSRLQLSVQVALFAIVGGLASSLGPAIGAIIFVPITILLRAKLGTSLPGLHMIIYATVLILVLLYMPKGIYGTLREKFFPDT